MKITFSSTHNAWSVKAPKGTLISLTEEPTVIKDGVYTVGDDGYILIDDGVLTDSIYLDTAGNDYTAERGARVCYPAEGIEVRAGSSVAPFMGMGSSSGSGGGDGDKSVELNFATSAGPELKNGRIWGNWKNSCGIQPRDTSGERVKCDWTKDYEIGTAFMYTSAVYKNDSTSLFSTPKSGNGNFAVCPMVLLSHSGNSKPLSVRKNDITLNSSNLWNVDIDIEGNNSYVPQTWYFVKVYYTAETKTLYAAITKDFTNWVSDSDTHADRTPATSDVDYVQFACNEFGDAEQPTNLVLDLGNTYIMQNGQMLWGNFFGDFPD